MSQSNDKPSKFTQYQQSEKVDNTYSSVDKLGSVVFYMLVALLVVFLLIPAILLFTVGQTLAGIGFIVLIIIAVAIIIAFKSGTDWLFDRSGEAMSDSKTSRQSKSN
jgi:hypothetical protein